MAYLEWKGINSNSIDGLIICELPPITKPKMRTSITKIDGKDGDIIEELGYESYIKNVKIGLTKNFDLEKVIKYFTGSGTLILSDEPNKVYNCKILEKIDYEKLLRFKTAIVKFYTQPFKYLKDESPVDLTITTENSLEVNNQGLEIAKPIVTLYGEGEVELFINGYAIFRYTFPEDETEVVIDCLKEEAYLNGIYKNRFMNGKFPELIEGINTITWSGNLSRIIIEPKSRWL